ncbi:MAG: response regulator [Patescibacteria group bacterium]
MKNILFIEDEYALQKTFREFLSQKGYTLISAMDGEEGLELANTRKPDLILLDLILPKIHGFDVLKKLKDDEKTKNIPIIVLTSLEGVGDVDKVVELGATTYLIKSQYTLEEVLKKVEEALEQ